MRRIIGIDPGLTYCGIVLARARGKISEKAPEYYRHATMVAEGETWLQKCDNLVYRIFNWIINNTNEHDELHIIVEEPVNMMMQRAWSAAIQNRLFGLMLPKFTELNQHLRPTTIYSVYPTSVKKLFTGNGRAKKPQIVNKAKKVYTFKKHYSKALTECLADAIAITYCGWRVCYPDSVMPNGITILSGERVSLLESDPSDED